MMEDVVFDDEDNINLLPPENDLTDNHVNSSSSSLPSTTLLVDNNHHNINSFNDVFGVDESIIMVDDKLFCPFAFNWKSFMAYHQIYCRYVRVRT